MAEAIKPLIDLSTAHYEKTANCRALKNKLQQLQQLFSEKRRGTQQLEICLSLLKKQYDELVSFKKSWTEPDFINDVSTQLLELPQMMEQKHTLNEAEDSPISAIVLENDIPEPVINFELGGDHQPVHFKESEDMIPNIEDRSEISSSDHYFSSLSYQDMVPILDGHHYHVIAKLLKSLLEEKIQLMAEINELEKKKSSLLEISLRDRQEWLQYKQSLGQICKMIASFSGNGEANSSSKRAQRKP